MAHGSLQLSTDLSTHSICQPWNGYTNTVLTFTDYDKRPTKHNYGYQWLFVFEQDLNDWLCLSAAYHNINTIGSRMPLIDMQLINQSINHQVFVNVQNYVNPNHLVDKLQLEYSFMTTQIKLIPIVQPEQQIVWHRCDFDPYQHIMECMTWTPIITKHEDKHNLYGK